MISSRERDASVLHPARTAGSDIRPARPVRWRRPAPDGWVAKLVVGTRLPSRTGRRRRDARRGRPCDAWRVTPEEKAHLRELVYLRRARDLIDRDYARPLDVPAMARTALMSPAHFSRRFRAAYGETPYSYLMTRRIERAKALLRRGELSVTDVCMAVGCTSLGSFSARFTELVGESPSAYRVRDHAALAPIPGCWAKVVTRPVRRAADGELSRNREAQANGPA